MISTLVLGGSNGAAEGLALQDKETTGTVSKTHLIVDVMPESDSTRVVFADKAEINYASNSKLLQGGYVVARESVINTAGAGTVDKLVGEMVQLNLTGGNVTAAVCVEAEISTVGAGTLVAGLAGFYFPNLEGVPNIANVQQLAAFQNDHKKAVVRSAGPFLNGKSVEVAPPAHAGLAVGRYYSAPAKSMTQNVMAPNVIYINYVHVPRRCKLSKLGFNVTGAVAGNARLGLYNVVGSGIADLIVQSGDISTASVGPKEANIDVEVDSGVYAVVVVCSANPVLSWHEIASHDLIGSSSPTGFSEIAYVSYPYGALPPAANLMPTFAANTIEPHLWFRISA